MKKWIIILALLAGSVLADDTNTQTNTSGSNTNITGGYESTSTTTYEDGATNTTTTNNDSTSTTNNKSTVPPPSANSPSYSSMSQDVCSMGVSGSITTGFVGISGGKHFVDENCERIKLAKVLQDFGMKVASVAVLCQDKRVHAAMESAGTPCPYQGLIGPQAQKMWDKYPEIRPDYEEWKARNKIIAKVDERIAEEERIAAEKASIEAAKKAEKERIVAEEEAAKAAERIQKELETLKEKDEVNAIDPIIDTIPINVHE